MNSNQIRQKFLDYFKKNGHKIMPSAPLIPKDKTVLLTIAGMQQMIPYFLGKEEPPKNEETGQPARRLTSVQKCFRTPDIDDVGDDTHHTFFEMLGNFSVGDYFKEEAIKLAWEFLTKEVAIPKEKLWVTIFAGEKGIPEDEEAKTIWQKIGVPDDRIKAFGKSDNWWGPPGPEGPCGPASEVHYDRGPEHGCSKPTCGPNCDCGRFVEVWNLVFMGYYAAKDGFLSPLASKNIDTGMGFERLVTILQNKETNYDTDLFQPLLLKLGELCPNNKNDQDPNKDTLRSFRIIADHIRGAVFLATDGIRPSNEARGYILRRVLRRAIRHANKLSLPENFITQLTPIVVEKYADTYPELKKNESKVSDVLEEERAKFAKTLRKGLKVFEKVVASKEPGDQIEDKEVFRLYDTYGFPFELTKELATERNLKVSEEGFEEEFRKHQEISRAGAEKKFGGVGKHGKKVAPLHTATHLLHQALRDVLGPQVKQKGSDITPERLRFDFNYDQKLTPEQIAKVEDIVNSKIKESLEVTCEEMSPDDAIATGAIGLFGEKYGEKVKVYSIGDYSKEICAGPHVAKTAELGRFKITKEESSGAGTRRIKAVLE